VFDVELLAKYDYLVISYSGGIDSSLLLYCAMHYLDVKLQKKLSCIHVNHGLSTNANAWEQHCIAQASLYGIPIKVCQVQTNGKIDEAHLRELRYTTIAQHVPKNSLLMCAHHLDDQIETLLFRLFRGDGFDGLAGIHDFSKIFGLEVYRPLLTYSKQQIIDLATKYTVKYINDESNSSIKYSRNFLRNEIIPLIAQRWPQYGEAITNVRSQIIKHKDFFAVNINKYLQQIGALANSTLVIKDLEHAYFSKYDLVRFWLKSNKLYPKDTILCQVLTQVVQAKSDKNPMVQIGKWQLRRSFDKLFLLESSQLSAVNVAQYTWQSHQVLKTSSKLYPQISFAKLVQTLQMSGQQKDLQSIKELMPDNVELTVKFGIYCKKAKERFRALQVPTWKRHEYPLIYYKHKLIAILGLEDQIS